MLKTKCLSVCLSVCLFLIAVSPVLAGAPLYSADYGEWRVTVSGPEYHAIQTFLGNKEVEHINFRLFKQKEKVGRYEEILNFHIGMYEEQGLLGKLKCAFAYESKIYGLIYSNCSYGSLGPATALLNATIRADGTLSAYLRDRGVTRGTIESLGVPVFANKVYVTPSTFGYGSVVAVDLVYFRASPFENFTVNLSWETGWEDQTSGFNIFRGTTSDFQKASKVRFEPSKNQSYGSVYSWSEKTPSLRPTTYYYWLQEVDVYGYTKTFPPITVTTYEGCTNQC